MESRVFRLFLLRGCVRLQFYVRSTGRYFTDTDLKTGVVTAESLKGYSVSIVRWNGGTVPLNRMSLNEFERLFPDKSVVEPLLEYCSKDVWRYRYFRKEICQKYGRDLYAGKVSVIRGSSIEPRHIYLGKNLRDSWLYLGEIESVSYMGVVSGYFKGHLYLPVNVNNDVNLVLRNFFGWLRRMFPGTVDLARHFFNVRYKEVVQDLGVGLWSLPWDGLDYGYTAENGVTLLWKKMGWKGRVL